MGYRRLSDRDHLRDLFWEDLFLKNVVEMFANGSRE